MTGGRIPAPLDDLGAVFVPIDPREKGTTCPRTDEHFHGPEHRKRYWTARLQTAPGIVCARDADYETIPCWPCTNGGFVDPNPDVNAEDA